MSTVNATDPVTIGGGRRRRKVRNVGNGEFAEMELIVPIGRACPKWYGEGISAVDATNYVSSNRRDAASISFSNRVKRRFLLGVCFIGASLFVSVISVIIESRPPAIAAAALLVIGLLVFSRSIEMAYRERFPNN